MLSRALRADGRVGEQARNGLQSDQLLCRRKETRQIESHRNLHIANAGRQFNGLLIHGSRLPGLLADHGQVAQERGVACLVRTSGLAIGRFQKFVCLDQAPGLQQSTSEVARRTRLNRKVRCPEGLVP